MMTDDWVRYLRCPIDGAALVLSADRCYLINRTGNRRYPVRNGIALLLKDNAESLDKSDGDSTS